MLFPWCTMSSPSAISYSLTSSGQISLVLWMCRTPLPALCVLQPQSTWRSGENPSLMPPGYTGAWHLDKMFIIKMNSWSPTQSIFTPARVSSHHPFVAFNTWRTLTPWLHPAATKSSLMQRFSFTFKCFVVLWQFCASIHAYTIFTHTPLPSASPSRWAPSVSQIPLLLSCGFGLNFCFVYLCVGETD